MGLSRQEYWSGVPLPSPGEISDWKTAALRYGKGEPIQVCHGNWYIMLHSEICVLEIWPSSNTKGASQEVQ